MFIYTLLCLNPPNHEVIGAQATFRQIATRRKRRKRVDGRNVIPCQWVQRTGRAHNNCSRGGNREEVRLDVPDHSVRILRIEVSDKTGPDAIAEYTECRWCLSQPEECCLKSFST